MATNVEKPSVDSDDSSDVGTWYMPNPNYQPGLENDEPRHIPTNKTMHSFIKQAWKEMLAMESKGLSLTPRQVAYSPQLTSVWNSNLNILLFPDATKKSNKRNVNTGDSGVTQK